MSPRTSPRTRNSMVVSTTASSTNSSSNRFLRRPPQSMDRNISDVAGTLVPTSQIGVYGEWDVKVIRHDGKVEQKTVRNIVTKMGLNHIANRALNNTTPFYVIGVGTQTAAHSLDSVQAG